MSTSGSRVTDAMQGVGVESGRSVASGMKAQDDPDKGYAELYRLNQIWYRTPPQLSLVAKRTKLQNQAQRFNYTNPTQDVITFIFNSGEFYVNMATSYLYIEFGYNNPKLFSQIMAYISQGNIMSIFDEIVFMSSSGTEVNREQNKGLHAASTWRWTHDQQYINTYGQAQGAALGSYSDCYNGCGSVQCDPNLPGLGAGGVVLPHGDTGGRGFWGYGLHNVNYMPNVAYAGLPAGAGAQYPGFIIPMDQILGCFKPYMNCLLPAGLLAGGRLEMRLKNPSEIFQLAMSCNPQGDGTSAGTAIVSMNNLFNSRESSLVINKIYINFDAFQLSDAVIKRLVEVSSGKEGLTLLFDTYDFTPTPNITSGVAEASVTQARSRTVRSFCVVRDDAAITNPYVNSMASEGASMRPCQAVLNTQAAMAAPTAAGGAGDIIASGLTIAVFTKVDDTKNATGYTNVALNLGQPINKWTALPADPSIGQTYNYNAPVVGTYQAQLGSLFFPQQPLTTLKEYYDNALYIWCKSQLDNKDNCAVSFEDFIGGRGFGWCANTSPYTPVQPNLTNAIAARIVFPYGCAIYGMLAEKSALLQLSGLPIANSRLLRHKFTFNQPTQSGNTRTINVFTQFTRMLKVFLGGRVVVRE